MTRYKVSDIRNLGQPQSVMNRRVAEHWTGPAYMRKFSPYVSQIFLRLNVSPTQITWMMVFTGWLASWILTNPFLWGAILAFLLAQLQMLLDCSDGEVARVTKNFNPAGIFIDRIGHYTTESFLVIAFAIRIADNAQAPEIIWGFVLALLVIFNKLLNDLVHVTRAIAGYEKLTEDPNVAKPRTKLLAMARNLFRFLPIHKLFHSIELTTIFLVAALIDFYLVSYFERLTLQFLTLSGLLVVIGHTIAILNSNRLKK